MGIIIVPNWACIPSFKFGFFCSFWAITWRKTAASVTHSITH